jgi:hypothetical protein
MENAYIAMVAGILILLASMASVVGHSNIWTRSWAAPTKNVSRLSPCTIMIVK